MILPNQFDPKIVKGFLLPKLTQKLPSRKVKNLNWKNSKNVQLADRFFSGFSLSPAPVDLFRGADVLEELMLSRKIKLGTVLAIAETKSDGL